MEAHSEEATSVSVIIPAHDPGPELARAVASVTMSGPVPPELIVVDDGSRDAASQAVFDALEPSVVVRRLDRNVGPSGARNEGARHATRPWLVFLDSDDQVLADGLDRLLEAARCGGSGLVRSQVRHDGNRGVPSVLEAFTPGSFMVESELFHAVGGYDEALRYGENSDLIDRLTRELDRRGQAVAWVDTPTVATESFAASRDYNRYRMEGALHVLARDADLMAADVDLRIRTELIAAVNATRVGEYAVARACALRAVRSDPRRVRSYVSLALVWTGPIARQYWLWRQGRGRGVGSR